MLAKLEQDLDMTLQSMPEEYQRILNQKYDSMQIEEIQMLMEIQVVQQMLTNKLFAVKGTGTQKNSVSVVIRGEIISVSLRISW